MKDYKSIIQSITEAVELIKDEGLKEQAFNRLMEDALAINKEEARVPNNHSDASPKTTRQKSGVSSPYTPTAIRKEVKSLFSSFDANVQGMKPLRDMKKKWEQYLWILEFARKKSVEAMTNSEIAYVLSDIVHIGGTEKQVNNLNQKIKDGYVQLREVNNIKGWKILSRGIEMVGGVSEKDNRSTD